MMQYVPLIDHFPGCSPLNPCGSCRLRDLLKKKLSQEEFDRMIIRLQVRARRRPSKPKKLAVGQILLLSDLQKIIRDVAGLVVTPSDLKDTFRLRPKKDMKQKSPE
jgi:hypothetical protein